MDGAWWNRHQDDRKTVPPPEGITRMCRAVARGANAAHVRFLRGGLMGATHAVDVTLPRGGVVKLVLKRFPSWASDSGETEWHRMSSLVGSGIPSPEPLLKADAGEWFPEAAFLMTRLPGRVDPHPRDVGRRAERLADTLTLIHGLGGDGLVERTSLGVPVDVPLLHRHPSPLMRQVAATLEPQLSRVRQLRGVLLHADLWSGNVLWSRGRLTGIVDWASSRAGARGYDLAYCRVDSALLCGPEAADRLLASYQRCASPVDDLPFWDLVCGASAAEHAIWWCRGYREIGRHDITTRVIKRRLDAFLRRALAQA